MNSNTRVIKGTNTNLASLVCDGITVLDWWAKRSGPCQQFAPIFEATATKNADLRFVSVDVEQNSQAATKYSVTVLPTIMVFKDGQLVYSQAGAINTNAFDALLRDIRRLPKPLNLI